MSGELLYWSNFLIFTFLTTIVRWKPFRKKQTESEHIVTFSNSLYLRALSLPLSTAGRFQRNLCIIFWIAAVAFMLWVLITFFFRDWILSCFLCFCLFFRFFRRLPFLPALDLESSPSEDLSGRLPSFRDWRPNLIFSLVLCRIPVCTPTFFVGPPPQIQTYLDYLPYTAPKLDDCNPQFFRQSFFLFLSSGAWRLASEMSFLWILLPSTMASMPHLPAFETHRSAINFDEKFTYYCFRCQKPAQASSEQQQQSVTSIGSTIENTLLT